MSAYFNYPSLGLPDETSLVETAKFLSQLPSKMKNSSSDYTLEMVSIVEKTREKIAAIYEVLPSNISFITNTTEGLGLIASALYQTNIKVDVTVPDIEFISSALVWRGNSDSLHLFETMDGIVLEEQVIKALNEGHNILCMSSVQEVSGYRFSFLDLLNLRKKGPDEFWIVDGIQEAGVFKRDVMNEEIDAYIVGGHKWLGCPFGLGFMYLSNRLIERIEPIYDGYFNLQEPTNGWVHYLESRDRSLVDLDYMNRINGARKFESGGMVNVIGAMMLGKSIDRWQENGVDQVRDKIFKLQHLFRGSLKKDVAFKILGSENENTWSSIITLTGKNGVDEERKLLNKLLDKNFKVSLRSIEGIGGIRIGFHFTNTSDEVMNLVEIINRFS